MTAGLRFYPRGSGEPRADLAAEEALLAAAAGGSASLLCFAWDAPALVLGYGQDAGGVELVACRRLGVPVYRRITGGTGVLHHHALSLSLALPAAHPWCHTIASLYDGFVETLRGALTRAGRPVERGAGAARPRAGRSPICFEEIVSESLLWEGRKVFGGAQARRTGACLVHGTLLFGLDAELQAALYGVPPGRIEAALGAVPPPDLEALVGGLGAAFSAELGLPLDARREPPLSTASHLARYDTPRWAPLLGL